MVCYNAAEVVAAVCLVLASSAWSCHVPGDQGAKENGPVCGTIGRRIVGDTVSELQTGFKKCVAACKMSADCTAVNYWSRNNTCQLVRAVDSPQLPHQVEVVDECFSSYLKPTCTVTTSPSTPLNYKFVLPELTAPFKVQFAVRVAKSAIIALATDRQDQDIFGHITLGGWDNKKSAIRTGDLNSHTGLIQHAVFNETNQLSALEYRAFWIEYANGLLKFGKCTGAHSEGASEGADWIPFMQWNVGTYLGVAPSKVNIAISTWRHDYGEWVFEQLCE